VGQLVSPAAAAGAIVDHQLVALKRSIGCRVRRRRSTFLLRAHHAGGEIAAFTSTAARGASCGAARSNRVAEFAG
jgi:hypothetical protein